MKNVAYSFRRHLWLTFCVTLGLASVPSWAFEWERVTMLEDPNWDISDGVVLLSQTELLIMRDGFFEVYVLPSKEKVATIPFPPFDLKALYTSYLSREYIPSVDDRVIDRINPNGNIVANIIAPYCVIDKGNKIVSFPLATNNRINSLFSISKYESTNFLNNSSMLNYIGTHNDYPLDSDNRLTLQLDDYYGFKEFGSIRAFPLRLFRLYRTRQGQVSVAGDSIALPVYGAIFKMLNRQKKISSTSSEVIAQSTWIRSIFLYDDVNTILYYSQQQGTDNYANDLMMQINGISISPANQIINNLNSGPMLLNYLEIGLPSQLVRVQVPLSANFASIDNTLYRVQGVSLPIFRQISNSPFDFSPRGNLFAFPEKDPTTGLFKHWSVYRIILDGTINNNSVRVRSAPNTTGTVLTQLNRGARVKVLDRTDEEETIGGQTNYWYQIRLADRREGWVFGAFLDASRE